MKTAPGNHFLLILPTMPTPTHCYPKLFGAYQCGWFSLELQTWVLYVLTVLALMSTPGASQLLMLSNSATHGFRKSLATAAGDLSANSLQMIAATLGLDVIVTSSETAHQIIKWLGVAYLIWHGLRTIKTAKPLSMKKDKGKQFEKTLFSRVSLHRPQTQKL